MDDSPDLLTASEVAKLLRVDQSTVTRWATDGETLRGIRIGGVWRFRRSDVEALLTPVTPEQAEESA